MKLHELNEMNEIPDEAGRKLDLNDTENLLDSIFEVSEIRLEYHSPSISPVSFGSVCTT